MFWDVHPGSAILAYPGSRILVSKKHRINCISQPVVYTFRIKNAPKLKGGHKEMYCSLSWLTNSESKCGGMGEGIAGSKPMSADVYITWHWTQLNFRDLTPYLTYALNSTTCCEGWPCDILVGSRVSGGRVLLGGRPEWEERAHRRPSGLGEGGAPAVTGTGSLGPVLRIRTTRSPENFE
jgi:hypothetical protein